MRLITRKFIPLNASDVFPAEVFLQFWEQITVCWAYAVTERRVGKHLPSILFHNFRYCTWYVSPRVIMQNEDTGCEHGTFCESLDSKYLAETFCSIVGTVAHPLLVREANMAAKATAIRHRVISLTRSSDVTQMSL